MAASRDAVCVGITVLTGAPIHDALAVGRAVKAANRSTPIVWGGWHPSLLASECLDEPSVDIVVSGQGEDTFRNIVDRLIAGESVRGCQSGTMKDLNAHPAHDYSLIPVESRSRARGRSTTSRRRAAGFRCAFCADPAVFNRGWTGLLPERIADEISFLHQRYGVEDISFQDETFFTHALRVNTLADEFLKRNLPVTWTATLRADQACRLGEDLCAKTVRSGLRRVMVGVESGWKCWIGCRRT